MRLQNYFLLLILLLTIGIEVKAQDFMVLEKMGTKKRHEFYAGDEIIFMLKEEKFFRKDEIVGLGKGEIFFETGPVPLKDIVKVSLSNRRGLLRGTGTTLVIGGLGYMALDLFNKTITGGEVYVDEKVARTAGIIAGTGLGMILISRKKVSLKNNWRLRIVDI